ncbi:hypothetical protein [Sulfuracidifex tepidarius]|uniref:Uncharacterized protein n=1 Tax=Sulfuracidifex tepidarius TaxID=1294262 RepID=A0A510DWX3_9CREN|nr:hypothetical protein [Sulfuracidifex tepidarius]BBG24707.1 hypothetical protein IC006_2041 [Sulfuracidifex tepidarius]BBG27495.1 hypothetical protein IC007_2049 [Sulfuracidifex tepidarius]
MESVIAKSVRYTDENGFIISQKPCKGFAVYLAIMPTNSVKEVSVFKIDGCKEEYVKSFDSTEGSMEVVKEMEGMPQGLVNVVLQTLK